MAFVRPSRRVFAPPKASALARCIVKGIIAEFLPVGQVFTIFSGDCLPVGICRARLSNEDDKPSGSRLALRTT